MLPMAKVVPEDAVVVLSPLEMENALASVMATVNEATSADSSTAMLILVIWKLFVRPPESQLAHATIGLKPERANSNPSADSRTSNSLLREDILRT